MENINEKEAILNFATKIKALRLEKKVTQQEAYIDTGVHFGRLEQGKINVTYTTLLKLKKYFNCSINAFFE